MLDTISQLQHRADLIGREQHDIEGFTIFTDHQPGTYTLHDDYPLQIGGTLALWAGRSKGRVEASEMSEAQEQQALAAALQPLLTEAARTALEQLYMAA